MAHLDRNGVPIEVGQKVKLVLPGTGEECVGEVVGTDFLAVYVEAVHNGHAQSVTVVASSLETINHEGLARAEQELTRAIDAEATAAANRGNADAAVKITADAAADAKAMAAAAKSAHELTKKNVDVRRDELERARGEATKEREANDTHGAAVTIESTKLQVTTDPIIGTPLYSAPAETVGSDPTAGAGTTDGTPAGA